MLENNSSDFVDSESLLNRIYEVQEKLVNSDYDSALDCSKKNGLNCCFYIRHVKVF